VPALLPTTPLPLLLLPRTLLPARIERQPNLPFSPIEMTRKSKTHKGNRACYPSCGMPGSGQAEDVRGNEMQGRTQRGYCPAGISCQANNLKPL